MLKTDFGVAILNRTVVNVVTRASPTDQSRNKSSRVDRDHGFLKTLLQGLSWLSHQVLPSSVLATILELRASSPHSVGLWYFPRFLQKGTSNDASLIQRT